MTIDRTLNALAAFMRRHQSVALLLSAGKDSGACLKLLRPYMGKVVCIWANPGDPYPETLEYMAHIRATVPRFVEAKGHQPEFVHDFGHPVDLVPFESTPVGRLAAGKHPAPKLVQLDACCSANMWGPLWQALKDSGATGCVRGDKRADTWRPGIDEGAVIDGIEYHLPLAAWLDAEVYQFLGDEIPASYKRGHPASFDCMTCTAYLGHNQGRVHELGKQHPLAYAKVQPILWHLRDHMRGYLLTLEEEL